MRSHKSKKADNLWLLEKATYIPFYSLKEELVLLPS